MMLPYRMATFKPKIGPFYLKTQKQLDMGPTAIRWDPSPSKAEMGPMLTNEVVWSMGPIT